MAVNHGVWRLGAEVPHYSKRRLHQRVWKLLRRRSRAMQALEVISKHGPQRRILNHLTRGCFSNPGVELLGTNAPQALHLERRSEEWKKEDGKEGKEGRLEEEER